VSSTSAAADNIVRAVLARLPVGFPEAEPGWLSTFCAAFSSTLLLSAVDSSASISFAAMDKNFEAEPDGGSGSVDFGVFIRDFGVEADWGCFGVPCKLLYSPDNVME